MINFIYDIDVEECEDNNGGCAQLCNNTVGSFICGCSEGYTLNADYINCSGMHYHSRPEFHVNQM